MPRSTAAPKGGTRSGRSRATDPIEVLRLSLALRLRDEGAPLSEAARTTDAWLLCGLAAEQLGLASATSALELAAQGHFAALSRLQRQVESATGLRLPFPATVQLALSPPVVEGPSAFASLAAIDDPFGVLGQWLRARRLTETDGGGLSFQGSEARRDESGYYTPFALAKRLAARVLLHGAGEAEIPTILDPACGAGTFLAAAFDLLHDALERRRRAHPSEDVAPVAWAVAALHGVELDETALWAARLSIAVRAVKADRTSRGSGQLALFGLAQAYGPLIVDRIRLGDSLGARPADTLSGTERLRLRLLARDEPGHAPEPRTVRPMRWDADFPLLFSDDCGAFRPQGGFELVMTNPPFVPVDRISSERRRELLKTLDTAQRRFDLFIGFVERALTLLARGGRALLLVPRTFLYETNAEKCRRLLLERATIERIEELGAVSFDGARVECVALTFAARRSNEHALMEIVRPGRRKPATLQHLAFRRSPGAMFRPELAEPGAEEVLRLADRAVPLGRYLSASWGARGSPVKDFHLDAPGHPLARPMLKGDDVTPFRLRPSSRWLLYDVERLYRPSVPECFESEKLVVKKVTGAKGIVCAVDSGGHYTDDSLCCVVRKSDLVSVPLARRRRHGITIAPSQIEPSRAYDLHLVAALLQTPLVQRYYRVQLGGGLNVFPRHVEALPLPAPERLDSPEARMLSEMARRAAEGDSFDSERADALARLVYGLD